MKTFSVFAALVSLVIASHSKLLASEDIIVQREAAERFATLPDGVRFPEGITANPWTGEIYVATFDLGPNSTSFCGLVRRVTLSRSEILVGLRSWDLSLTHGTTRSISATSALRRFSASQPTLA